MKLLGGLVIGIYLAVHAIADVATLTSEWAYWSRWLLMVSVGSVVFASVLALLPEDVA